LARLAAASVKGLAVALASHAEVGNGLHRKALGARLGGNRHDSILVHLLAKPGTFA
jgi:hypothetical protein